MSVTPAAREAFACVAVLPYREARDEEDEWHVHALQGRMAPLWRNAMVNQERVLDARWRRERFATMRAAGYTVTKAARALGIGHTTAWKYERARLAAAPSQPAASSGERRAA